MVKFKPLGCKTRGCFLLVCKADVNAGNRWQEYTPAFNGGLHSYIVCLLSNKYTNIISESIELIWLRFNTLNIFKKFSEKHNDKQLHYPQVG